MLCLLLLNNNIIYVISRWQRVPDHVNLDYQFCWFRFDKNIPQKFFCCWQICSSKRRLKRRSKRRLKWTADGKKFLKLGGRRIKADHVRPASPGSYNSNMRPVWKNDPFYILYSLSKLFSDISDILFSWSAKIAFFSSGESNTNPVPRRCLHFEFGFSSILS